jgi:hypothetical protein
MDYTKTGVIVKDGDTLSLERLIETANKFQDARTVESWNYLREQFKTQYAERVIWMLDASGFISKWLSV